MRLQQFQLAFLFLILASVSCFSASFPSEYSIVGGDFDEFVSEERVVELFQQWKDMHEKVYMHVEEAENRFKNFKNNLKYIVEKKNNTSGHVVGLNKFADMSNEEFREIYLKKIKKPIKVIGNGKSSLHKKVQSCEAPSSLDWRKKGVVTPVKDQGSCGSCWAFSTIGAIEGINALATGDLISLSAQELVDCDTSNNGCEGGNMDTAFEWVIKNGGINTESDYPYTGFDGTCKIKEETKVVSIDGYKDVEPSESALLCAAVQQPVSVGMDGSAIDFQLYTNGIYDGDCHNSPYYMDHAVLIVGYDSKNGEDYWIAKNSWGTGWGIDGYFYIKRDTSLEYGKCGINSMVSYPTKESSPPSPYSPTSTAPPSPPPSPPPPSPSPSECGDFSYCPRAETCCCLTDLLDICFIYGCCPYENAVCCDGTSSCCPGDYPICDISEGLCLKNNGDYLGVAAKKRKMAKHKFPWTKIEETEKTYQPLLWKRNPFAEMR